MNMQVIVIGAGITGVATAKRLAEAGHDITLVEPTEIGGTNNAAYGNGALVSNGFMVPISSPGLWRQVPGYLVTRDAPLAIRWRDFPGRALWGLKFLAAGATATRQRKLATGLAPLVKDAPALHARMIAGTAAEPLLKREPVYYLYPNPESRSADGTWAVRREFGISCSEKSLDELQETIAGLPKGYVCGSTIDDSGYCLDTSGYIKALLAAIPADRLTVLAERALGFVIEAGKVTHLRHSGGETACDAVVICAGHASAPLAAELGDHVPLGAERGYCIQYRTNPTGLTRPVMLADQRIAITPKLPGLRVAGQVEIADPQAPANWTHVEILHRRAVSVFPELDGLEKEAIRWMGVRPSMTDCTPVIGARRAPAMRSTPLAMGTSASPPLPGRRFWSTTC